MTPKCLFDAKCHARWWPSLSEWSPSPDRGPIVQSLAVSLRASTRFDFFFLKKQAETGELIQRLRAFVQVGDLAQW